MRVLLLVTVLTACSANESEHSPPPCEQLRDHLVDLRVAMAQGTPEQLAQHRTAMTRALGDDFIANCAQKMNASQIACSLAAPSLDGASACATHHSTR